MNDSLGLLVYVVFGAFGLSYFVYGKRQKKLVPLICGIGLMIYPYFLDNAIVLVVIGLVLLGIPWFIKY